VNAPLFAYRFHMANVLLAPGRSEKKILWARFRLRDNMRPLKDPAVKFGERFDSAFDGAGLRASGGARQA
jgi:hypothetical protein